ncbi:NAD(P)/FAD-dependent oxidoreductase [Blastococcus mobilis]|uniref:D-amino-acid dehydrogenase n=1 Tax=Blastococcus mobilis TaxID=1938746 RepID=A0A238X5V5_9ACTN|nr:FAD-dependent oxidoreductase [Blastococcus mobilis]SNR53239.1 D-amino-acid dehydrogenase [Blastococcus mobilis]
MSPRRRAQYPSPARTPQDVAVIGAGMVGLATAWFLQEGGARVTVYERDSVAAGASWGNAGWLTPSLTAPLPEPAVLRYGLRAVLSPSSPVYLPLRADRGLLRFLTSFVRHSTPRQWRRGMAAYVPLNERALDAFDVLIASGVEAQTHRSEPFLAVYRSEREREGLLAELRAIRETGQPDVLFGPMTGEEARALEPTLTDEAGAAVQVYGQRYLHPPEFVRSLGLAVRAQGGAVLEGAGVTGLRDTGAGVVVTTGAGERRHDAVVVATGAWLDALVRQFGVRQPVQAGRGYSFSVPVERLPAGPLYFPQQRVACTPLGSRLRVAGMMEFRRPDEPLDPRRITAIVDAVRPFLAGVDLDDRQNEWVGSRPCTGDGLPLLGGTRSPRVFVAGGHGMWGIALGPITGMLMAQAVLKGEVPAELRPFDPLR